MMRSRDLLAITLLVLAAGGCSSVFDDSVVIAISTVAPSLVDSDLTYQRVEVGVPYLGGTIQNVYIKDVTILALTFDEFESDMLFDQTCSFFDAWTNPPFALGKCASGVVLDGDDQAHTMSLKVEIQSMTVQRVPPLPLPPSDDHDADGVNNANDNCVLVDNPDQTDTGMKGYGDACAVFDFVVGIPRVDNDADGIADSSDNCPYTPNPGQEDSGIDLVDFFAPDGIGDACVTEEATVRLGSTTIELSFDPKDFVLPLRRVSWLTVDFRDETVLKDCWDDRSCDLQADQVGFCLDQNGGFGCTDNP